MNREMIGTWLGLPEKRWPPDPYALLGLKPDECNAQRIEEKVQERMAKLRCYQLSHPAEATEGMNRVAQAFIFLVEQHCPRVEAKQPAPAPPPPAPPQAAEAPLTQEPVLDWQAAPPPIRNTRNTPLPVIPVGIPEPPVAAAAPPPAPVETDDDLVQTLAEESDEARSGLMTLRDVIDRADQTRQLLIAWRKAGRYFGNPKRQLTRNTEKNDFGRRLEALRDAAEAYPGFVAQPGRPGYRAVALAHLGIPPDVFNAMAEDQRDQLARDWAMGQKLLLAHRRFLLRQFKSLRRRNLFGRIEHALRISYRDYPVLWALGGATAAVVFLTALVVLLIPR
jgi:hypothetical protein